MILTALLGRLFAVFHFAVLVICIICVSQQKREFLLCFLTQVSISVHSCVLHFFCRSGVLFEQIEKWNKYESEVKGLLDWISDEANKFSKKVTTAGDEGIEDHIESCRVCGCVGVNRIRG